MLLFGFRKSDRSRVEACIGLLLALIVFAFPMTWWLRTALVIVLAAISAHLIFSSPTTVKLKTGSKVGISVLAIAIIAAITWNSMRSGEQLKYSTADGIVEKLKEIPIRVSNPAKTDESLQSDTANLVRQLREFQQKVDDWNRTAATKLNQDVTNEKSDNEAHKLYIEHTKQLSAAMANLYKQFNSELKPQVIAVKNRLLSKFPPKSVQAKPTVDYTLNYGFTTFPNAIGDIADYLESLAAMLPHK
jgi:hypothetical protein